MKRFIIMLLALVVACASADAQFFSGLSVRSHKINSAYPTSLRSVRGKATVTVQNSGSARSFKDITAVIYRRGEPFFNGTCSDINAGKGTASYTLIGNVSLVEGKSVWDAIGAALSFRASEYTADVSFTVTMDGKTQRVTRKGVAVSRYLH